MLGPGAGVGPPLIAPAPALTPVLTFRPRAIVWLWFGGIEPAFTCVLIFILVYSFLEILSLIAAMAVALLVKLLNRAGYYWRIFFSVWSSDWRGVGEITGRHTVTNTKAGFNARLFALRLPATSHPRQFQLWQASCR
jgi:hypothetical protein